MRNYLNIFPSLLAIMGFFTILLFFVYSWGLGYSITFFLRNSDNFFERNIMRVGIGLGVLPILAVILNLVRIPLDWKIMLVLSLAIPVIYLINHFRNIKLANPFKVSKSNVYIFIVLLMFLALFGMYHKGSFAYPYLEDGDPWLYAVAAKYIAVHDTYSKPVDMFGSEYEISHYTEPYPAAYNILMGILHQTSPSINWTLKFFNALMLSLSLVFFYFFVKRFSQNKNLALASTFVMLVIPCFLGHFIFSQVLGVMLFFPALYCLAMIEDDKKWAFVSAAPIASILFSQLVTAAVFAIIFAVPYFIVILFKKKELRKYFILAGLLGAALSLSYWGEMVYKFGYEGVRYQNSMGSQTPFKVGGTLGDIYGWDDFIYGAYYGNSLFSIRWANAIDSPIGLGWFLFALLLISFVLVIIQARKIVGEKPWLLISTIWLILTYVNIRSGALPVGFVPHRSWTFFAIPVSIIAGYGIIAILSLLESKEKKALALVVVITLLLVTSGYPKYYVNTVPWPQHRLFPDMNGELGGYLWLNGLPVDTMVTSLCRTDDVVIGFDKMSTAQWDRSQIDFKKHLVNYSSVEISEHLKKNKYQFAVIDSQCVERFGINETNTKLNEMVGSGLFISVLPQNFNGIVILKVF